MGVHSKKTTILIQKVLKIMLRNTEDKGDKVNEADKQLGILKSTNR